MQDCDLNIRPPHSSKAEMGSSSILSFEGCEMPLLQKPVISLQLSQDVKISFVNRGRNWWRRTRATHLSAAAAGLVDSARSPVQCKFWGISGGHTPSSR